MGFVGDGWGLWVQLMGGAGVCSGRLQLGVLSSCSAISCSVVSSSASRPGHLKKMASQRLSSKRMERGRARQMERGRGRQERGRGRQERGRGRQMERERSLFTGMADICDNKEFEFA